MTHRKDLIKDKFISKQYDTSKRRLQSVALEGKESGKWNNYRIVPYKNQYELYVKK